MLKEEVILLRFNGVINYLLYFFAPLIAYYNQRRLKKNIVLISLAMIYIHSFSQQSPISQQSAQDTQGKLHGIEVHGTTSQGVHGRSVQSDDK